MDRASRSFVGGMLDCCMVAPMTGDPLRDALDKAASRLTNRKMVPCYEVSAMLESIRVAALAAQPTAAPDPDNLPDNWYYQAETNFVVCGGCAFRYGAEHSDGDGKWTCPNCGDGNGQPAAPLGREVDAVRQTIADEWGSHLCYQDAPTAKRTCDHDKHCRCADIARAVISQHALLPNVDRPTDFDEQIARAKAKTDAEAERADDMENELHELRAKNVDRAAVIEECAKVAEQSYELMFPKQVAAAIRALVDAKGAGE
jgi:hypothetical protein